MRSASERRHRDSGTSADRPVVAAGHGLCAVGAGRVAVKASGRRAGVGRMWSDDVVAPAGGACRALRRVRSIQFPPGGPRAAGRTLAFAPSISRCEDGNVRHAAWSGR
uniref:Uncharacterized protein n=1 Tax=Zea mays TaxID=4577 RepID=A0A804M4H6_MAIZE